MTVALLLISDGRRDYLKRTLDSAKEMLPDFDHFIHVDDAAHQLGFAGAIKEGWRRILATDASHVFHLEQDFTFNRPVPVDAMIGVLAGHPHLVQLALLRQPWNAQERAAGGIIQTNPADYTHIDCRGQVWLEHKRHFTTNPCLYPRWVAEREWPERPESEGHFGIELFAANPGAACAYLGDGEEWVTHIGVERLGAGY